jgi:hypothetical protein
MSADPRQRAVAIPSLAPLFDMVVDLKPREDFDRGPLGRRVLFGSAGGSFDGTALHGTVLAGGGDWAVFRADGVMTLDVRLTLRMHDGALVLMTYVGRWVNPPELREAMADPARRYEIGPERYYFRTAPLFETGSDRYAWLNDIVAIGSGYLVPGGVAYRVFHVL